MKHLLILLLTFVSSSSFAISTKDCPETFQLKVSHFTQGDIPENSEDNPNLPYAYILVKSLESKSETMNKVSAENASCYYESADKKITSSLYGSLKEGASEKAVLRTQFSEAFRGMSLGYIVYTPVRDLTKDKVLVLAEKSSLYYRGEQCQPYDCIPDNIRLGSAKVKVEYVDGGSCISLEDAKVKMQDYLNSKTRYKEKTVSRLVGSMGFQEATGYETIEAGYYTEVAESWECAPSAECWFGYYVNCAGQANKWSGGEE